MAEIRRLLPLMTKQNQILKRLQSKFKLGDLSLACLLIACLSGIFLAYQYDHQNAYNSIISIDVNLPWGKYLRSFHWYSSQIFFILLTVHTAKYIWNKTYHKRPAKSWIRLTAAIPFAALYLFTGYVLKGDVEGTSAGIVAEHLALSVPIFGDTINRLLFAVGREGLTRVYVNHVLVLGVLSGWILWKHLKKRSLDGNSFFLLLMVCLALSTFSPAPMGAQPSDMDVMLVKGPWFCLGIQELLRYFPPFWAGVMFPATIFILISSLPICKKRYKLVPLVGIALFLTITMVLTVIAYLR